MPTPSLQMVDLQGQHARLQPELDAALAQVMAHGQFIRGPEVEALAQELAHYLGVAHVIPCGNGTDALQLALMALDLPRGGEVIMPAFNYIATAEAAALLGLRPVFVDIDPATFQLDVAKVADALTDNTVAIMPVHLFGQCVEMGPLLQLARQRGLYVVEDAAQAIGATCRLPAGNAKQAGTMGHLGTTSFFPSKNLGCLGDGGAVFTDDPQLAERVRLLANHGQPQKYQHTLIGLNSRLDTLQAAVLRVKLRHLPAFTEARQVAAQRYDALLGGLKRLTLPAPSAHSTHVFHQYTVRVPMRAPLRQFLQERGIPTMIYYPMPLHLQPAFAYLGHRPGDFPVAEQACLEVLSLPMHTELTPAQQHYLADCLDAALKEQYV
ncbi:DegT/DnrJ/EryC1/StrS family aminotransferase [Catalinimonas alkaloidigena]|nr:DegT/DnrJ/EryC1/StrS family aminotransferase [Catalinimonas alkaloidigena]